MVYVYHSIITSIRTYAVPLYMTHKFVFFKILPLQLVLLRKSCSIFVRSRARALSADLCLVLNYDNVYGARITEIVLPPKFRPFSLATYSSVGNQDSQTGADDKNPLCDR